VCSLGCIIYAYLIAGGGLPQDIVRVEACGKCMGASRGRVDLIDGRAGWSAPLPQDIVHLPPSARSTRCGNSAGDPFTNPGRRADDITHSGLDRVLCGVIID